jgi:hypothetical protein
VGDLRDLGGDPRQLDRVERLGETESARRMSSSRAKAVSAMAGVRAPLGSPRTRLISS